MYNPIEEKRRFVEAQIQKSFDSGINVAEEIELEKAHKDGDHHPTKPWVWVSSANGGKGDWRVEGGRAHKKAGASTAPSATGSKVDIAKIPNDEFKRITQMLEKKNPDHMDAERYLEEEAMSDNELKNFHAVAEHFKNSSKINKLTQEYCRKWAELAKQEIQSRNNKSGANQTQSSASDLASKIKANIEAVLKVAGVKSYSDVVDVKATDTSVIIKYNDSGQHTHTLPLTKSVALNVLKLAENQKNTPSPRKPGSTDEIERMTAQNVRSSILGLNNIGTNVKDKGDHFLIEFDHNDFTTHGQRSPQIDRIAKFLESMGASCVIGNNSIKAYKKVEAKKDLSNNSSAYAQKVLGLMQIQNSKYKDISKVKATKTDKGNWVMSYDGKDTGLIIGKDHLSESELKKLGVFESYQGDKSKSQSLQDKVKDIMQQFDDTTMDEDEFDEYVDSVLGNDMGQKLRKQILESNKSFSDKKQAYKDAVERHLGLKPQKYSEMDAKQLKAEVVGKTLRRESKQYGVQEYNIIGVGTSKDETGYVSVNLKCVDKFGKKTEFGQYLLDGKDHGNQKFSIIDDDKTKLDSVKKKQEVKYPTGEYFNKLNELLSKKGYYAVQRNSSAHIYKNGDRQALKNLKAAVNASDYIDWGGNDNLKPILEPIIKQAFEPKKDSTTLKTDYKSSDVFQVGKEEWEVGSSKDKCKISFFNTETSFAKNMVIKYVDDNGKDTEIKISGSYGKDHPISSNRITDDFVENVRNGKEDVSRMYFEGKAAASKFALKFLNNRGKQSKKSDPRDKIAQDAGFKDYEEMKGYQDYVTQKNLLKKRSTSSGMRLLYQKEIDKYEKNHADLIKRIGSNNT